MMDQKAFYKLSYGLYIISSSGPERPNGQVANSLFQTTSTPAQFALSLNKQNLTCEYLRQSQKFSVSVLAKSTPIEYMGRFGFKSGRDIDKFEGISYKVEDDIPIALENAIAYFTAKVVNTIDAGTHILFIAEVKDAEILKSGEPMTYAYYHQVKGGKSPQNAPAYIEEKKKTKSQGGKKRGGKMQKYKCKVCGYIYDPEKGDPDSGIVAGTLFSDIPDDWVCPVCGVGKDDFEPIEE